MINLRDITIHVTDVHYDELHICSVFILEYKKRRFKCFVKEKKKKNGGRKVESYKYLKMFIQVPSWMRQRLVVCLEGGR